MTRLMRIAGGFDFLSFEHRWRPKTLNQQYIQLPLDILLSLLAKFKYLETCFIEYCVFIDEYDSKFEYGIDLLREQAKKFALDIGEYQKNIGTNSKSSSWIVCCAARDKDMLSKKYDKLFGQEDKK